MRYCGNVNMGVRNTNSLLAYARAAAKTAEIARQRAAITSEYAQSGGSTSTKKKKARRRAPNAIEATLSTVSGMEGLSTDLRHAVKDIMKTDTVRECRLIPTPQDLQEQCFSQSGSLADDDTATSDNSPTTAKVKKSKRPIQFKHRLFDIDSALNLKKVKAIYDPNQVYRTPPALMTAKERSEVLNKHVGTLRILQEARDEKSNRFKNSLLNAFRDKSRPNSRESNHSFDSRPSTAGKEEDFPESTPI